MLIETDNTNSARDARVAFDAGGNAMAVWIQSDGVRNNVLANRYTAGQGWGSAVLIETDNTGPALEPRIVFDGNGNATAVWSHRDVAGFTFNILANRWTAATGWGTAVPIDNAPDSARAPQLGVDGFGNVIAVWSPVGRHEDEHLGQRVPLDRHDLERRSTAGSIGRSTRHAPATRQRAPCRRRRRRRPARWPRAMPRCSPGWRSRGRRRAAGWRPCSGRRARPSRPETPCASACSSCGASSASSWSAATRPCRWRPVSSTTSLDSRHVLGDSGDELGPELAAWLGQQRERRALRHRAALEGRADAAEQARDYAGALAHARELLALEPLSEAAHRRLIRVLYLQGDRAAALLAFDRCEQMLKDEVGTAPSAETLALLATISAAGVPALPAPAQGLPASVLLPPRLIGREAAWRALHEAWDAGRNAVVTGEGGMGKSRLVGDFARARGRTLVVGARPGDARVVYASAARLLRALPAGFLRGLEPSLRRTLAWLLPELGEPAALPGSEGRALPLQCGQRRARGRDARARRVRRRRPALRRRHQHRAAAVRDRRIVPALDRHRARRRGVGRRAAPCSTRCSRRTRPSGWRSRR